MNKIVFLIFGIFITVALLVGLYNYSIILEVKEDTTQELSLLEITNSDLVENISLLERANADLAKNISLLEITNSDLVENISLLERVTSDLANNFSLLENKYGDLAETTQILKTRTDILEDQQQSLLQEEYDFLLFSRGNMTIVKSGITGKEVLKTTKFSEALQHVRDNGKIVIFAMGSYDLDSEVIFESKSNMILDGQGSVINLNGYAISFVSDHYSNNSNNQIRNFVIRNGTINLEDAFRATFEKMVFEDCESAIEVSNTYTWSEATKFENCYWENCRTGLTFKEPTGNATGSYENTALDRCYFNLYDDNSVAIMVEKNAEVSSSQWTNMRIWMHANNTQNQTGLHLEGVMSDSILSGVVFESFGNGTIYGIYLGEDSIGFSHEGTSFLGDFDARIKNLDYKWIYGDPSVFKEYRNLKFGEFVNISRNPATIGSFDAFIEIENLSANEEVNVTIILNFLDQTSHNITKSFIDDQTYWLTDDDLFYLYPSQNMIWNIEVIALSNVSESQTEVHIGVKSS